MNELLRYDVTTDNWHGDEPHIQALRRLKGAFSSEGPIHITPDWQIERNAPKIVEGLKIDRTFDPEVADATLKIPLAAIGIEDVNSLDSINTATVYRAIEQRPELIERFNQAGEVAARARTATIIKEAWWLDFKHKRYLQNPFNGKVTEQFDIVVPDNNQTEDEAEYWAGGTTNVYNFGKALSVGEIKALTEAIGDSAFCSRGATIQTVPNVLLHDSLELVWSRQHSKYVMPLGLARLGRPYIEANRYEASFREPSLLGKIIRHELTHQIDTSRLFAHWFDYIDYDKDGAIDFARARCTAACTSGHVCHLQLVPSEQYALSSHAEHFADAGEKLVGEEVIEPIRRDIYLRAMDLYMGSKPISSSINPGQWTVYRRTGSEITTPRIPRTLTEDPLLLYFSPLAT